MSTGLPVVQSPGVLPEPLDPRPSVLASLSLKKRPAKLLWDFIWALVSAWVGGGSEVWSVGRSVTVGEGVWGAGVEARNSEIWR